MVASGLSIREEPVPGFKLHLRQDGDTCRLLCQGTLDGSPEQSAALQPELLHFHEALVARRVRLVRLDFRGVDYMNSGGIKSFTAWFLRAERTPGAPYAIEIAYDPARTWQQVSFSRMGWMAPKVLRTVPVPAAS